MSENVKAEDPGRGRACEWCGDPVRQTGVGRARRYCSQACRQAAYAERRVERLVQERLAHRNRDE